MTAKFVDYYRVLGVARDADEATIKKAFRQLARQYHPDVTRGNKVLEAKFKDISEAYAVLSDPDKRHQYDGYNETTGDLLRNVARENSRDRFTRSQPAATAETKPDPTGNGFSDFFDSLFGAKRQSKQKAEKGGDRQVPIEIQLHEAYAGTKKSVRVDRDEPCTACSGKGQQGNSACRPCQGSGLQSKPKAVDVQIPAGVRTGSRVRIMGEGGLGRGGGDAGDLYLNITVRPHPFYELQENGDILLDLPIMPAEAALGIELQVPTLGGRVTMKIPAGTQGGQQFRLRGRGLPKLRGHGQADQLVKIRIAVPQTLTLDERDLYLQLGRLQRENPRRHLL